MVNHTSGSILKYVHEQEYSKTGSSHQIQQHLSHQLHALLQNWLLICIKLVNYPDVFNVPLVTGTCLFIPLILESANIKLNV